HIHKFGGASLANAAGIAHAAKIVVGHRPAPQVVVVSAMSGVTDALLDCAARASRGDAAQVRAAAKTLRARHAEAVRALVPRGARLDELAGIIDAAFAELEQLAGGLGILREITPRPIDYPAGRRRRSDEDAAGARSGRARGVALEGRAGPAHRGSAGRARRARGAAGPPARSGGARVLRRQGAAPAHARPRDEAERRDSDTAV